MPYAPASKKPTPTTVNTGLNAESYFFQTNRILWPTENIRRIDVDDITSTNQARRESYLMLGICCRVTFSVAERPAVELFRNQPYLN